MTLAKLLAGGLLICAVLTAVRVAATISSGDHGSTFAGGPLVCNASLAVLDKIRARQCNQERFYLKELPYQKLGERPHVNEVHGLGLLVGIELDVQASSHVDACINAGLPVLTAGKRKCCKAGASIDHI